MSLLPSDGKGPFLRRVQLRSYKSIGACDVELGQLTVLVGRNGAGKSNFLDALRFVADGLQTSLDHAVKARGGIDEVRRRSTGHPRNVRIGLELEVDPDSVIRYGFEIAAREHGAFAVKQEQLRITNAAGETTGQYTTRDGTVTSNPHTPLPVAKTDRLFLVAASSLPVFRPAYDALSAMGFYNLNPETMKELQSPDAGELLHRDGSNIASVIDRLTRDKPELWSRIKEYLETVVPGIKAVERVVAGPKETLEFRQEVKGSSHPWRFYASSMSDGTLRSLGALTAVMQLAGPERVVSLVGIEEPESALHPAATGALVEALREAATRTQVIVTTHSPDLLDQTRTESDRLLAVQSDEGETQIAPLDAASRETIRDHLYTAGELLRMDQLRPDAEDLKRQASRAQQMSFAFDETEGDEA